MGFMDRFRAKPETFAAVGEAELGTDLAAAVTAFQDALIAQPYLIERFGTMAVCRSPVLVVRDGKVLQPASVVPAPMLDRFWSGAGREVLEGTELAPVVERLAPHFAASDELTRAALSDVHEIYVSDEAPAAPWPTQDRRLRLVSLILVDAVRKLAAGFSDRELSASYGLSRTTEHDAAARNRYQSMTAEEDSWIRASLASQ